MMVYFCFSPMLQLLLRPCVSLRIRLQQVLHFSHGASWDCHQGTGAWTVMQSECISLFHPQDRQLTKFNPPFSIFGWLHFYSCTDLVANAKHIRAVLVGECARIEANYLAGHRCWILVMLLSQFRTYFNALISSQLTCRAVHLYVRAFITCN